MNTLRRVRFKVAWQHYRVGDEITPNGTLRDWLVQQGYADVVEPGAAKPAPLKRTGKPVSIKTASLQFHEEQQK